MSDKPKAPFNPFTMSLTQAKQMMVVYNSYRLWRKLNGLPDKEPTPEELDEFNRTVLMGEEK